MGSRKAKIPAWAAALVCLAAAAGAADLKTLTRDLFAIPSTTGNEEILAARIRASLPKTLAVEADALGTIAVRFGEAPRTTLLLAGLDGVGHMVSGIRPDGYLTLDRPVPAPHARFDAYLLGQPVIISTAQGPVQGVVAQPSLHLLTQERRIALLEGFSLEEALVDVGARSEKEARAKGIEILDPVTYPAALTELAGEQWAGPGLGAKAAAAALVCAAEAATGRAAAGGSIIAWAAQTKLPARGRGARPAVGAVRAKETWRPVRTVVVDVIAAGKGDGFPFPGGGPVLVRSGSGPSALAGAVETAALAAAAPLQFVTRPVSSLERPFADPPAEVVTLALPVRFLHTPSEIVALGDLRSLRDILIRFLETGDGR
ncbi:MAG: hypothetical protein JW775_03905 [Candidatus Aminicenantes bacterium]|nr:hypothetical protein [Candidatus Aminicenantes bacterium]